MLDLPFESPYPRPSRLSNAGCCYSDDELNTILAKPDEDLDWKDYNALFEIARCTATYAESCYFLPWAFRYIQNDDPNAHECMTSVINFVSEEADALTADGLFDACLDAIRRRFAGWTAVFVVHHAEGCCYRFGKHLQHGDNVENTDFVTGLIDDLVTRSEPVLIPLAEELVLSLADAPDDPVRSAWFLEYAKETFDDLLFRQSADFQQLHSGFLTPLIDQAIEKAKEISRLLPAEPGQLPPERVNDFADELRSNFERVSMTPSRASARIQSVLQDKALLQSHLDRVKRSPLASSTPPSYWADLSEFLELRW